LRLDGGSMGIRVRADAAAVTVHKLMHTSPANLEDCNKEDCKLAN